MAGRARAPLTLAPRLSLAAALLALTACSSGSKPNPRCELDLAPYRGASTASGAVARRITSSSDLLQGDSAWGRVGDYLLANDLVRVVIQQPDRHIQPNPFGGALLDADVVRTDGTSSDQWGKLAPFYNFGRTPRVEHVDVLDAGGRGAAVIAATGPDDLNDYMDVRSLLPVQTAVSGEAPLPLLVTTYYVLAPGSRSVHVVTALCNQGQTDLALAAGDLLDSGGDVEFFNPLSKTAGFGFLSQFPGALSDFPFYAFWGQRTAYAYAPSSATGNNQFTVSGVVGTLVGSELLDWLGAAPPRTALRVPKGGSASYARDFVIGHDLGEVTSTIYAARGATHTLSGSVTLGGQPVAGARVAIVLRESDPVVVPQRHPIAVLSTASDGTYAGQVPPGTYEVAADFASVARSAFASVDLSADARRDFALPAPAVAHLHLRDPAGAPVPGKVVVYCQGDCPVPRGGTKAARGDGVNDEGNMFRSSTYDPWGEDVQAVAFVDPTGDLDLDLPAGTYQFVASHGPAWSVFPDSWPADRGTPRTLAAGGALDLTMELAKVVDTTGWVSADFHVHGLNSHDSPVALLDRVRTFLAEGVDLLVATDHDYVTDYAPSVKLLDDALPPGAPKRASDWLATMMGEELTTFTYGHWNGFPLQRDAADLTGGAIDWAGGTGPALTPKDIHDRLRALPGTPDRVVQVNHPRGSFGYFTFVRLDTASGQTHACPQEFRMPPLAGCDPAATPDTGLFDEGFTSMEIVNDFEEQRIHGRMNDWFTFLSRGLTPTATAVSDTHHRVLFAAGYGRTYVNLPGVARPADIDPGAIARAVNAHRAVASMGGFATLTATNGLDGPKGLGEVARKGAAPLHLAFDVQAPAWLAPAQVELHGFSAARATRYDADAVARGNDDFGNRTWPGYACDAGGCNTPKDAAAEAGELAAAGVQVVPVTPAMLVPAAEPAGGHLRWHVTGGFDVSPAQDAWYVLVVRRAPGEMASAIAPAVAASPEGGGGALSILAVTNPIFVDVDGNGRYDPPKGKEPRATPYHPLRAAPITVEEAGRRMEGIAREK